MRRMHSHTKFRREREMVHYARNWLSGLGLMVKEEFYTPWGVCDLVGISFVSSRVKERLTLGQKKAIGPPMRIELLSRIPESSTGKTIAVSRLERELGWLLSQTDIEKELDYLEQGRFVQRVKKGRVQKLNGWAPLHDRIVALELKLNRVEDAINQARSHLGFVDESYVGLPARVAMRVAVSRRAKEFERSGVGLIAIGRDRCTRLIKSKNQNRAVNAILQMHCAERFWRSLLRGS